MARRIVALIGSGVGPKVALRTRNAVVRIRGLTEGGRLMLTIDETQHEFDLDGDYPILGGEFAKAEAVGSRVICELLMGVTGA